MNIKERINTIKAKKAQIEALLSAKEKEVEEEYQMVMELYNEVSERVEAIKTKQKTTEETLDKYDGLLAFLNDDAETTEEPVVEEEVETKEEKTETTSNDSSENIDDLLKLIDSPKEELPKEKKEVKPDGKWKVVVEKETEDEKETANKEEIDNLIDQFVLNDSQKGTLKQS